MSEIKPFSTDDQVDELISNEDFVIEEGILCKYKGASGNVIIPENVAEIYQNAFESCAELTSVTIPCTVQYIGEWAFANCPSLKDIIFEGTKRQWKEIIKENNWDSNTKGYTLHCADDNGSSFKIIFVDIDVSADLYDINVIIPQMIPESFSSAERAKNYLSGIHIQRLKRDLAEEMGYEYAENVKLNYTENGNRVTIDEILDGQLIARHEYTVVDLSEI